jgi:DNA invertase Pin-like site-specific DNA recombinase
MLCSQAFAAGRWTTSDRKLKCTRCGKWFKAADYRHTLCPACTATERSRKATLPPSPPRQPAPPAKGPASAPAPAPQAAATAPAPATPAPVQQPPLGEVAVQKRAAPRRPPELSAEQRQAIEARYLELATPHEYDGIRSQIARELHLPRAQVKRAVNELRLRLGRPSWWDEQRAAVAPEVVAAVRERYVALLAGDALPPVGIHSELAAALALTPVQVYRAIGQIRAELGLPKFNERPEAVTEGEVAALSAETAAGEAAVESA